MVLRGILYVVAVLAIGLAALLLLGKPEDECWSLEGQAVTTDSCMVGCPCILGEARPHGRWQFAGILHITKGRHGTVGPDDANFSMARVFSQPAA